MRLAAIVLFALWVSATVAQRAEAPSRTIVLVSLDTVRADALGAYGGGARTPHLDALATRSVRFTHHFAAAPTTLASHASLLTGQYPHTHGVPRNGFALRPSAATLAEVLAAAGYETAGFVGADPLDRTTGISQGFHTWDDVGLGYDRPGTRVVDRALDWLDARADPRPLLLFVHLFDAHAPYDGESLDELAAHRAACEAGNWDEGEGAALRAAYLDGVGAVDHQVGRLLTGLGQRGALDGAIVLVTADHGETYDTHEECWNHGYTVYDETTRIPLLVAAPGLEPTVTDRLSGNVDVLPSLLDLLGLPEREVDGISFAPTLRGEAQPRRAPVFSESTKPFAIDPDGWTNAERLKSARSSRARLVWDPLTGTRRLYTDPGELVDRWPELAATPAALALERALGGFVSSATEEPSAALDDEATRRGLEALGYLE